MGGQMKWLLLMLCLPDIRSNLFNYWTNKYAIGP